MAKIIAVCRSEQKGTRKTPQSEIEIKKDYGDKMRGKGYELQWGDFAENLTTEGIDLCSLPVGTRLEVGKEVVLEMTQIGKECHKGCAIRELVGDCIMPREGIFAKVMRGGRVRPGDEIKIIKKRNAE
jgi:MOSC domain-containing protein YiiM